MNTPLVKIRETIRLLISHPNISIRQAAQVIDISRPSTTKVYAGVTARNDALLLSQLKGSQNSTGLVIFIPKLVTTRLSVIKHQLLGDALKVHGMVY